MEKRYNIKGSGILIPDLVDRNEIRGGEFKPTSKDTVRELETTHSFLKEILKNESHKY